MSESGDTNPNTGSGAKTTEEGNPGKSSTPNPTPTKQHEGRRYSSDPYVLPQAAFCGTVILLLEFP